MLDEKEFGTTPDKTKFKLKRRQKTGGKTNKEKRVNHPQEMLRPKKNRNKNPMKQIKNRIKNIKRLMKVGRYGQQRNMFRL